MVEIGREMKISDKKESSIPEQEALWELRDMREKPRLAWFLSGFL